MIFQGFVGIGGWIFDPMATPRWLFVAAKSPNFTAKSFFNRIFKCFRQFLAGPPKIPLKKHEKPSRTVK